MKKTLITLAAITLCCYLLFAVTAKSYSNTFNLTDSTMKDNTLSAEEKAQGWKLLFNGQSLKGWHTYQSKPSTSWMISDGVLVSKADKTPQAKHADLVTDQEFANFELSLDWKIPSMGNSGIMYLVTEQYNESYESGPEYQLADDKGFGDELHDYQRTGANYAMNAPLQEAANPVGEWNHAKIILNKGHVEHWLNGKKVVEYELWTDEWKQHKEAGKWKDAPGYGAAKKGHIALQESHSSEGGDITFKNIKIKML